MDFLEKIGYTVEGKRLRKRFYHYSQRVIESQSLFSLRLSHFCHFPEVIFENNWRASSGTRKTPVSRYWNPADRVGCQPGRRRSHLQDLRALRPGSGDTGYSLPGLVRRGHLTGTEWTAAGSLCQYIFSTL